MEHKTGQAGASEMVVKSRIGEMWSLLPMDKIDLFKIYDMGKNVRPLSELSDHDATVRTVIFPVFNARGAIGAFLREPPAGVVLALDVAKQLKASLDRIYKTHFENEAGEMIWPEDGATPVLSWHITAAKDALNTFEVVFKAEMQKAATYSVPKRGTYDVGGLVDRAAETFPSSIQATIGKLALDEYSAAGRCFAFGLYTAAGYHSCRAVEAVLREYYRFFTSKSDSGTETWGHLISDLRNITSGKIPNEKTLNHICHVKDFDRNPLSHLRAILDAMDADLLLSSTKVAMMAMAMEMNLVKSSAEPTLALVSNNDAG